MLMKIKNKRSVSEMIAYVLLIVIAVSVSIIVYAILLKYIPKQQPACSDGVALIIEKYDCYTDTGKKVLNLTVKNQGTHSLDGFMAQISNETGTPATLPVDEIGKLQLRGEIFLTPKLKPQESRDILLDYTQHVYAVKVQTKPFMAENQIVVCESAISSQDINC